MALAKLSKDAKFDFDETRELVGGQSAASVRRSVTLVTDIAFWERSYGSHTRIRGLLRYLAGHHDVTVFFLKPLAESELRAFAGLQLPGARIVCYEDFLGGEGKVPKKLRQLSFFQSVADELVTGLNTYLTTHPSEVVVFEYIRLAYLLDACPPNTQTVLDMHDVMSERMMSLASAGLKPSIMLPMALEKRIFSAFDRVLAISRSDRAHVENVMQLNNVLYVPCAVEAASAPVFERQRDIGAWLANLRIKRLLTRFHARSVAQGGKDPSGRRLLFLGARSAVNVEGLKWFLDQVWPLLSPHGFQLDIVGQVGAAFSQVPEGVHVHGRQDDLECFFRRANISINPVFVGGGLKIKCVDALAAGIPCVTTPEGAAGLDLARYAGLYVTRSRIEFAKKIVALANNADERKRVECLGPLFIQGEFSQENAYTRLQAWMQSVPFPDKA